MIEHQRRTIDKAADRDGWLTQRAPYVGASDVAALFGQHPFKQAGDVAAEKLHALVDEDSPAKRRGRMLEDAVARWWAFEHGVDVEPCGQLYVIDDVLMVTPDFEIIGAPDELLEVKTTAHVVTAPVPYWVWQVQAQLMAADRDRAQIAALDGTMQLRPFTIERDEAIGEQIVEVCATFIEAVRAGRMPDHAPISKEIAARVFPGEGAIEGRVDLDLELLDVIGMLRSTQSRIRYLQQREGALKGQLQYALGERTDGFIDDALVCTWRPVVTHDIDRKKLKAEQPDIAQQYEVTRTNRRLLLKESKP